MRTPVDYGPEIESALRGARDVLDPQASRWTAVRFLDGDPQLRKSVAERPGGATVLAARDALDERLGREEGLDLSMALAEHRFARAGELAARAIPSNGAHRLGERVRGHFNPRFVPAAPGEYRSALFDRIATHRVAGPLLLFTVMYLVFRVVTDVSAPFVDWIDAVLTGTVGPWVAGGLGAIGVGGGWLEHLAVDGIIGGVGGMLAFVPVIAVLYVVLGLLEDSGYLARAAYLTDRAMSPMGLPGKSVLPLVVGFGCNVPALLAARVMDRPRDRLLTALLVPFVSCTARLPVYVLLAAALFPGLEGVVVLALYVTSVAAVFAVGVVLWHTLMRGTERAPFVLELPPYRRPSLRTVWTQTRRRSAAFIRKAGTVILCASVAVWFLLAIPVRGDAAFGEVALDDSMFGAAAETVGVVFTPAGFGAPELSGALAAGFVAKEIVVSTLAQTVGTATEGQEAVEPPGFVDGVTDAGTGLLTATLDAAAAIPAVVGIDLVGAEEQADDSSTGAALRSVFDESSGGHPQAAAAAFLVFVLLYVPCVATVATFAHEFGRRWAGFSVALSMVVAWLAAVGVFQVGALIGGA
ncbi:MAG: ferrous iron transport protein B [Pseudonocardia sp.]|nr:ferrous iron transport protein B [Pseudonocardia sp.]